MLAPHPVAFKNSGHIVPEIRLDCAAEPTTITTRGILIEAYVVPTKSPTIFAWLLPCSSTDQPYSVVVIQLRTPSSRTKRYSRVATEIDFIEYESEAFLSDLSYKRIYLKKAVEHNPRPVSRICHLRSYPSHLLEPVDGLVVDLDKPMDGPFLTNFGGAHQTARSWNQDYWTADLSTSNLYNGVALIFKFRLSSDQSKHLAITMTIPGPSTVVLSRHRIVDGKSPLDQLLQDNIDGNYSASQDGIWIPEINNSVAVKVDVEVEHGGIVYVFDVHLEPIDGKGDKFVLWRVEGEEEQFLANFTMRLEVPPEDMPELQARVDRGELDLVRTQTASYFLDSP